MGSDPPDPGAGLAQRALELGGARPDPAWEEEVRRLAADPTIAGDHVTIAVDAVDATVWDPEESARGAARLYAAAGRTQEAFDRLLEGGRRLESALQFDRAAEMYAAAAAVPGLTDELVDTALVREARARGAYPKAEEMRAATWRRLYDRADLRGDDQARARALYHLYWCDPASEAGPQLLEQAANCGTGGWSSRARGLQLACDGEHAAAIEANQRALGFARREHDAYLESIALDGIGLALGFLGRLDEQVTLLRQSIAINEQDGDVAGALYGRCNVAENLCMQLRPADAASEVLLLRRLIPADEQGRWSAIVDALDSRVHTSLGDVTAAAELALGAAVPFNEPGSTLSDCVVQLTCIEAALDVGDLATAASLTPTYLASAERLGFSAFEHQAHWMQLRHDCIDGGLSAAELLAAAGDLLDGSDPWVGSVGGWWIAFRAALEGDAVTAAALARTIEREEGEDPQMEQLFRAIKGVHALLDAGDDRPLRIARRRWAQAGMQLDDLRIGAVLAAWSAGQGDLDGRAELARVHAQLEAMGAIVDADVVAERIATLGTAGVAVLEAQPLLQGVPGRAIERLRAIARPLRLAPGDELLLPAGTMLLLDDGLVRVTAADGGPLLALLGPGAAFDVPDAAPELSGTSADGAAGWSIVLGDLDAWLEQLAADERSLVRRRREDGDGVIERANDTRRSVEERACSLVTRLDTIFGVDGEAPGSREVDTGLRQQDLADLISASRKATTLLLSRLRSDGLVEARLGKIVIFDPPAVAALAVDG